MAKATAVPVGMAVAWVKVWLSGSCGESYSSNFFFWLGRLRRASVGIDVGYCRWLFHGGLGFGLGFRLGGGGTAHAEEGAAATQTALEAAGFGASS